MLPNSTERAVTISGNSEAVIQSIYHICVIMSEVTISCFIVLVYWDGKMQLLLRLDLV